MQTVDTVLVNSRFGLDEREIFCSEAGESRLRENRFLHPILISGLPVLGISSLILFFQLKSIFVL